MDNMSRIGRCASGLVEEVLEGAKMDGPLKGLKGKGRVKGTKGIGSWKRTDRNQH